MKIHTIVFQESDFFCYVYTSSTLSGAIQQARSIVEESIMEEGYDQEDVQDGFLQVEDEKWVDKMNEFLLSAFLHHEVTTIEYEAENDELEPGRCGQLPMDEINDSLHEECQEATAVITETDDCGTRVLKRVLDIFRNMSPEEYAVLHEKATRLFHQGTESYEIEAEMKRENK
jgi:hypothetical protein